MKDFRLIYTLLLIALVGCTHNLPYRTSEASGCVLKAPGDCGVEVRHALSGASIQPTITYVEFDEQGEMHERRMAMAALDQLRQRAKARQSIILLFAHGWKHNAAPKDENLENFQNLLVDLSKRVN